MRVTVVGTGYIGLVQGACLTELGHEVTCVDSDAAKIASLQTGRSPIYEPGIEELIARTSAAGRLRFATPDAGWRELLSEVVIVAVGTPMAENGAADLSDVHSAVSAIARDADSPTTLVMKSTVPPGTGAALGERYLAGATAPIGYVSNPAFLREGHAIDDFFAPSRIVLGGDDETHLGLVEALYEPLVRAREAAGEACPVMRCDVASAETVKYASNAFLAAKISFINEIARVCDNVDADIEAVAHGMGLDPRIGPQFLGAGIGWGGSCFPKDTRALDFIATLGGQQLELLKAVIDVNNRQRLLPVAHIAHALPDLHRHRVAVLGLAFKPHTDDVRHSPALDVIARLLELGAAVRCHDPLAGAVDLGAATRHDSALEALEGCSAAVLCTEWPELLALDWAAVRAAMTGPGIMFDGRNALDAGAVRAAGLTYMAVGRDGAQRL